MGHTILPEFEIEGNTLVKFNRSSWKAVVPPGVEIIGEDAFAFRYDLYDEDTLETVILPQGVVSIGVGAFSGCNSLTGIHIPDTVTAIEDGAFRGCTSMETLTLPEGLISIGETAFYDCFRLTELVIPESVQRIGWGAFADCSGLQRVRLPGGIGAIPEYAFQRCEDLTDLIIPEGITAIGAGAFDRCCNLVTLTLPDSVRSIGRGAFFYCSKLSSVRIPEGAMIPEPIGELFGTTEPNILYTPGRSISGLGKHKTPAALGYMALTAQGQTFPPELAEEYEAYIRHNPVEFYFTDVLADLPLRHLMEHRYIPRKDVVLLLEMLELEDKFDLKASLLEYLGTVFPGAEPELDFTL